MLASLLACLLAPSPRIDWLAAWRCLARSVTSTAPLSLEYCNFHHSMPPGSVPGTPSLPPLLTTQPSPVSLILRDQNYSYRQTVAVVIGQARHDCTRTAQQSRKRRQTREAARSLLPSAGTQAHGSSRHSILCGAGGLSRWPKLRDAVGTRRGRTRVGGMGDGILVQQRADP